MDRITAIKAVARNMRDLITDTTPASLTGSSIDALRLIHPVTNQLKGKDFYIYSGAGNGQERIITEFQPANNRSIFEEIFVTTPSTNSNFIILDYFRKDEYDNALDRIIGMAGLKYLQDSVATLQIVGTQFEYPVPSGYEYISSLRLVPTSNSDYEAEVYVAPIYEFPPQLWHIESNPLGSLLIVFDPRKISLDSFDADWLRIMGQSKMAALGSDNSVIPQQLEEYVVQGASMIMSSQRISEGQEWVSKFRMFRDLTNELEDYIFVHRRGKRVGGS